MALTCHHFHEYFHRSFRKLEGKVVGISTSLGLDAEDLHEFWDD